MSIEGFMIGTIFFDYDNSCFTVQPGNRSISVWRKLEIRIYPVFVNESVIVQEGMVKVWASISNNELTDLQIMKMKFIMTWWYKDDILTACFSIVIGDNLIFGGVNCGPYLPLNNFLSVKRSYEWFAPHAFEREEIEHMT